MNRRLKKTIVYRVTSYFALCVVVVFGRAFNISTGSWKLDILIGVAIIELYKSVYYYIFESMWKE